MQSTRRTLLLAATGAGLAPLLGACASAELERLRQRSPEQLVRDLGVCAASYVPLHAGQPGAAVALSGCTTEGPVAPPDAIFQAASLSKPVVAHAALGLVRAGRLALEAPVSHYLPQGYRHFHKPWQRAPGDEQDLVPASALQRISLAQLLKHSAGLPNWTGGPLEIPAQAGPARWSYSGEGYMVLQAVLEAVTGQELAAYLDQALFRPLGMRDSSFVWREDFEARAVAGMTARGSRLQGRFRRAVAAASLYTTAADYARFMAAQLNDAALLALLLEQPVEVDRGLGLQWSLGWGLEHGRGEPAMAAPFLWQWGNNPGFRAFAMASTGTRDGFVLLSNSERGMPLAVALAQAVLPGEHAAFRLPGVL